GRVRVTSHEIANNSPKRINKARDRPITRALSRCSGGNFSARIATKTRLSIPKTISRITSVIKPTQIPGSNKNSIRHPPHLSHSENKMEDEHTAKDPFNFNLFNLDSHIMHKIRIL